MEKRDSVEIKLKIVNAGYTAIEQLIAVAEAEILSSSEKETFSGDEFAAIAADKLKNAAAAKKMAIMDAFEILSRIELETTMIESIKRGEEANNGQGFAERRSKPRV